MTAEQQLERSVLESKERDELHAIAQALSVKTTTRTKKADIIDGILKATGIGPADAAEAPGRPDAPGTRSRGADNASEGTVPAATNGDHADTDDEAPAGSRRARGHPVVRARRTTSPPETCRPNSRTSTTCHRRWVHHPLLRRRSASSDEGGRNQQGGGNQGRTNQGGGQGNNQNQGRNNRNNQNQGRNTRAVARATTRATEQPGQPEQPEPGRRQRRPG